MERKEILGKIGGIILIVVFLGLVLFIGYSSIHFTEETPIQYSVNGYMSTSNSIYWEHQWTRVSLWQIPEANYLLFMPDAFSRFFYINETRNYAISCDLPYKESSIEYYYILLYILNNDSYNWLDCLAIRLKQVEG